MTVSLQQVLQVPLPPSIRSVPGYSNCTTVHFLHLLGYENFNILYPMLAQGIIKVEDPGETSYCNCDCLKHRWTDRQLDGKMHCYLGCVTFVSRQSGDTVEKTQKMPATCQPGAAINTPSKAITSL